MKLVEQTKVTNKKRNGVAPFIKYFPTYISRVEAQLVGSDTLEIRASVDAAYEKLVSKMFDSLRQMAKMDGEGEDKGQLNYHVILIGAHLSQLYRPQGLNRGRQRICIISSLRWHRWISDPSLPSFGERRESTTRT